MKGAQFMKRCLGVLLAIVMLTVPAVAEELDLSSMPTDELISLSNRVSSELKSRFSSDADAIAEGVYVVGRDIKSGSYEFTCTSTRDVFSKADISVYVFPDEASLREMSPILQGATCLSINDTVGLNLVDGMVLYLCCCSGQLVTVEHSWSN